MSKFLVVDGNSLLNRAYYAFGGRGEVGELSFGGTPTNAVYGFLNMFIKAVTDLKADFACVAFDVRAKTFRHKMFAQYKANRHKMPDDLAMQLDTLKDILRTMKVKIYECEGYEADDIIGTVSAVTEKNGGAFVVNLTADRDGLQLVSGNTELHLTKTGVTNLDVWTVGRVKQEFGIEPRQLIDVKALMGDKSDNIPGAAGIGEKTALSLVQKYGTADGVIANANNAKVNASKDMVLLSRKLAEINCAVPIKFDLGDCRFTFPFGDEVRVEFEKHGFKSLVKRANLWAAGKGNIDDYKDETDFRRNGAAKSTDAVQDESKEIDDAVLPVLAKMSQNGIKVDIAALSVLAEKFEKEIAGISSEIYKLAGETFNINSTQILGEVLQRKLGIRLTKKTKTGFSTDEEVLTKLSADYPLAKKVLEYRGKYKLYSTYIRGYGNAVDLEGFIHTTFNIDKTATGRLSSTEPNLQNIPQRRLGSEEFRKIFVSRFADGKILSADYSQIELRLLAHFSGDKNLISTFDRGTDIHSQTALQVFGDINRRREAKAINFGIIYGISSFGLSRDLGCSIAEATQFIQNYFATFPQVKGYLDECIDFAKQNGYISTMFGRRRYIPELYAKNNNLAAFAARAAMNMPMQGSSADIIKKAMAAIDGEFTAKKLQSIMVLQIHDELVFDCVDAETGTVAEIVKRNMENAAKLSVPLVVDITVGESL
jgi:5'-3' exonuclease